jgi:Rhs element Vgr protein
MPANAVSTADRIIPNDSRHDVVSYNILIEGREIDATIQVMTIAISNEVNRVPTAKIIIRDGDPATETFAVSETAQFIPGKHIEIKMGRDGHNDSIFKGIIVKHSLKASQNANSTLTVECKDESIKLTFGRNNRYFEQVKDSDAISTVLSNFAGSVKATTLTHKEIVQYYSTDWDFALSRAEVNSLLLIVDGGKVDVKEPDTSTPSVLTLVYGSNLLEFESEMDARGQWAEVETQSWDFTTQALFDSSSKSSGKFNENGNLSGATLSNVASPPKLTLRHDGHMKTEELQAWAEATMVRSRMSKIRGRAKIIGFSAVKPGTCVTLEGMGARFNGKAYVTAVRHEVSEGTWFTHIQFGLSQERVHQKPDFAETPAAGLLPPIHGLHIGVVSQLENDPDGEDRILVKMPLLDNNEKGIWSRIATLDAGKERGSFFRPEIGDEVILGFINDDPRHAIILGMLNSSALPAPLPTQDTNHIKGFVTRSKMKVLFDDEKSIITIETPGQNTMIISDDEKSITLKDQNKNEVKLSQEGISMKSPKDIKIEADGKITIKSSQDLSLEGGTNATLKAGANLTAQGQAGAEFSSTAIAKLKGATVMIN